MRQQESEWEQRMEAMAAEHDQKVESLMEELSKARA